MIYIKNSFCELQVCPRATDETKLTRLINFEGYIFEILLIHYESGQILIWYSDIVVSFKIRVKNFEANHLVWSVQHKRILYDRELAFLRQESLTVKLVDCFLLNWWLRGFSMF